MTITIVLATVCIAAGIVYFAMEVNSRPTTPQTDKVAVQSGSTERMTFVSKTEEEWKARLTPEQYSITRQKGTERAFTGKYWNNHENGKYYCICCGAELFESSTKFESGSGWPSFYQPVESSAVAEHSDNTLGMRRVEISCTKCGAHLGHVFEDGPNPTGLRYCVNSASLDFKKSDSISPTPSSDKTE